MERKQLNYNAPILSVRRFNSMKSSNGDADCLIENNSLPNRRKSSHQSYKPDPEMSEVTKPVAVPFLWEQIPGRAKGGSDSEPQTPAKFSNVSGKELVVVKRVSEQVSSSNYKGFDAKGNHNFESEDDSYSDALDTLSPSESLSLSCSLSSCDGLEMRSSRTFCTDPQTRDYMMSRFLPAAKAMALETPTHLARKPSAAPEPPRQQVKRVVSGELRPLLEQYRSDTIPHSAEYTANVENEDEDDHYCNSVDKPGKACGLIPRFCAKNSLCLLNPVPGMKVKTRAPVGSAVERSRMTRTSYSGPLSFFPNKHDCDPVYMKRSHSGVQSHECEVESKRLTYSSELPMANGLSPHRRSRGGAISPYRNGSPQSPFHEGARFLGVPLERKANSFNLCRRSHNDPALSFDDHRYNKPGLGSVSPAVEKMLYIDSVNTANNSDTSLENRGKADSSVLDKIRVKDSGSIEANVTSLPDISDLENRTEKMELKQDCLKVQSDGSSLKDDDGNSDVLAVKLTAPPPLPKSPSESWLWRAIPSMSSRHSFSSSSSGSQFHPTTKDSNKTPSTGTKWETIVKTSKSHYDRVRYSQELLPNVSQYSKN